MSKSQRTMVVAASLLAGLLAFAAGPLLGTAFVRPAQAAAAEEEENEALIQMIAELVSDSDRDMRALGFQQVREEAPGEAATKKFAELLPKLSPDAQAGLLEALGDRQDAAALPAVLKSLDSKQENVRAAALGALGSLSGKAQVPLLAKKAASGSEQEKKAAQGSLIRLRGEDINAEIESVLAAAGQDGDDVRVALVGVLAARNAKTAVPAVLKNAQDGTPPVRLAALCALRLLADPRQVPDIVNLLKHAADDGQRQAAELALLTICSRGREACAGAVIDGLGVADTASQVVLLRVLARAGGQKALETIAARLDDKNEAVRDEAARMLSGWPTAAAVPYLEKLAKSDNLRLRVLAIRGLVRQACLDADKPADIKLLGEALAAATRPDEERLVLGVLGGVPTPEALALAMPAMDAPKLADEAALAAVSIAEKMKKGDSAEVRNAMQKAVKTAKSEPIRGRAKKVLGTK